MTPPRSTAPAISTSTGGIILPMSRPALGIITIFTFTNNWNDFF